MVPVEQVAQVLVGLADTLVDDFDVVEFLQLVTSHSASVTNAASAGLLLADARGQLQFMAASEESIKLLELFQLQNHEGPCLECFRGGTPVVNTNLTQAGDRWPLFAPRAVAAGLRSVHAFPLRHRKKTLGALNLFSTDVGRLEPGDVRTIQALADLATLGLLQEHGFREHETRAKKLQDALNSRVNLEQAKGVLARTHGLTDDEALEFIRRYAQSHQLLLSEAARIVVSKPTTYPEPIRTGSVDRAQRRDVAGASRTEAAPGPGKMLTPAEVAALLGVGPKTVTRWARAGKLTPIRTLGGHRRYLEAEINQIRHPQ